MFREIMPRIIGSTHKLMGGKLHNRSSESALELAILQGIAHSIMHEHLDGGYVDVKITCKDAFSEPPLRV